MDRTKSVWRLMVFLFITNALFASFTLISCEEYKTLYSDKFELRQLINKEVTTSGQSGYMFFAVTSYSSGHDTEDVVKCFANVDGQYRLIEFGLEDARIQIDNTIQKPTIQLRYRDTGKRENADIQSTIDYYSCDVIIHCPEVFLPEKLLPITLN